MNPINDTTTAHNTMEQLSIKNYPVLKKIYSNELYFFVSSLALLILFAHLISFICPCILGEVNCDLKYLENTNGLFIFFFVGSIFSPLIETVIFQLIPVSIYDRYVNNKTSGKRLIVIIASAGIFGLTHHYNLLTIIDAAIAGIIFTTIFFYFKERGKSGFFFTFLIHSLFNTYAFILDDLLKNA